MSSIVRSVSFRSARSSRSRVNDFPYTSNELALIHDDKTLTRLAEVGGVEGLAHSLRSNLLSGLSADEIHHAFAKRTLLYGTNIYPQAPLKTFFEFCVETLGDPLLILLLIAGLLSVGLGLAESLNDGWYEGISIFFAVILVTLVGSGNNWKQQKQFAELDATVRQEAESNICTVIRAGETIQIRPEAVQVGEIVLLSPGNFIPADGVLASADETIRVNESRMTGESIEIAKDFYHPFLLGGTEVRQGQCSMLVTAVGMRSAYGQIMESLIKEAQETPLQLKLTDVAALIGKIGTVVASCLFIVLLGRWIHAVTTTENKSADKTDWFALLDIIIVCVTLIVVAVPEGLPLAVTISLAYSMKKMYKDNIVVHELSACETMGNATAICSDKTGTLTQNRMQVVQCLLHNIFYERMPTVVELSESTKQLLIHSIVVNSAAWFKFEDIKKDSPPEDWPWKEGNQTDIALLAFCVKFGIDIHSERDKYPVEKSFPFDSSKKQSSVLMDLAAMNSVSPVQLASTLNIQSLSVASDNNESKSSNSIIFRRYFKGAAERIVASCSRYADLHGSIQTFQAADEREAVFQHLHKLTSSGLRAVACSFIDFNHSDLERDDEGKILDSSIADRNDCVLIGVLGIQDPLRPEATDSVRKCQKAGIVVRMLTGDALETAKYIATQCGIFNPNSTGANCQLAMTGPELSSLMRTGSEAELSNIIPRLRVLARSSPADKEALVRWLRAHGEIVAATGDGSNDAPQLNAAHVGIAMFIAGTAVAKAAAKIWILDDNFASIVKAVVWGRCVYDNIRKFVQFQLTVNLVALSITLIGALSGFHTPLTAVQLLWVNLIMDTFAALALGTEEPDPDRLLNRKPYHPDSSIVSNFMWQNIIVQAILQLIVLLMMLYMQSIFTSNDSIVNLESKTQFSMLFNTFVWLQLWNEINSRKVNGEVNVLERIFSNPIFATIWIVTIGVQIIIVELAGDFAQTSPLTITQWLICIGLGLLSIPIGLISRCCNKVYWNTQTLSDFVSEKKPTLPIELLEPNRVTVITDNSSASSNNLIDNSKPIIPIKPELLASAAFSAEFAVNSNAALILPISNTNNSYSNRANPNRTPSNIKIISKNIRGSASAASFPIQIQVSAASQNPNEQKLSANIEQLSNSRDFPSNQVSEDVDRESNSNSNSNDPTGSDTVSDNNINHNNLNLI